MSKTKCKIGSKRVVKKSRDPLLEFLDHPLYLGNSMKKSGIDEATICYTITCYVQIAKHTAGVRVSVNVWDRVASGLTI